MPGIISSGLKDCRHLQIVAVIASFDCSGNLLPLYVRIGEESYKISYCRYKPTMLGNCLYQCKLTDNGIEKDFELTYHERERLWSIPRGYS